LFLGHFARSDFQSFAAGIVIGDGAQNNCRAWERDFMRLQDALAQAGTRADADGWTEVKQGTRPVDFIYLRVGEKDVSWIKWLSCDLAGICRVSKCVDHDVSVSYQFTRRIFDRPDWQVINGRAFDLLKFVLIDLIR
jgi:hypothetical protein